VNDEFPGQIQQLRQAMSEWLGSEDFAWSSFGTYTFRGTPPGRAMRRFGAVLKYILAVSRSKRCHAFVCVERGRRGNREHIHALAEHPGIFCNEISKVWEKDNGFAYVKPYNPQLGAVHYVTKYIIKDACNVGDWAIETTGGCDAELDLYQSASRVTGYRLYTDYMRTLREKHRT